MTLPDAAPPDAAAPEAGTAGAAGARPARLLWVSRTWAMGGAQSILLSLARHLPARGFEIALVPWATGIEADAAFARAAAAAGARLTEPLPWTGWRGLAATARRLAEIAAALRPDVLHTHDNVSTMLVALHRRRFAMPFAATAFGWWELNLKLRLLYAAERRLALPRADRVYTVSHDMAARLRAGGTPAERIAVIHTGLDLDEWSPQGRRAAVRAGFGIPAEAVVVGSLSRVSAEKGLDLLLAAAARLAPAHPALHVLIIGKGPDLERLRGMAARMGLSGRVHLPGFFADGPGALEAMDVAAMPSVLPEGLPTAALEAQAMGLPVVAADLGGTRETLVAGETGALVPPGDAAALAEALRPLVADAGRRARMGAAARARIAAGFALPRMLDDMAAFYAAVQAKRR
jgi:glycosyltransferase involved in cell wall biosynthesis